jgi:hypothetical protein
VSKSMLHVRLTGGGKNCPESMLSISMICMPAGKRWDEHILVNVVVLYLNPHPGMLTKDAIMVMTGAHRCLPLSEGGS